MRDKVCINDNWFFTKDSLQMEELLSMEEFRMEEVSNALEPVNLPHTWNNEDGQDGGDDYYRGRCYYIKELEIENWRADRKYYLEFQGVNASADVTINGEQLYHHDGGYSTFRVNATQVLKKKNRLVVAADNGKNDYVYPQMADFTFYGGIYRDVYLIAVEETHFDLDYYGSTGVMITPIVADGNAKVNIRTWVNGRNAFNGGNEENVRIHVEGIAETTVPVSNGLAEADIEIQNVRLWQGRKDPYLYKVTMQLIRNGKVADEISARFGCRTIHFNPVNGFFLNGEPYPLRGVTRHQDWEKAGNALSREMHRKDMELILEMGANSVRLAHYQHDQYFYDLCDEYGVLVWAEIPYITHHLENGKANTFSQMKELVVQQFNHPSVYCWGISNEITAVETKPGLVENHKELNDMIHRMDQSRPTVIACISTLDIESEILEIPDIISYNLYFGWYKGELEDNEKWLDHFHARHPNKALGLSEYGAEAVLRWQTGAPVRGDYTEQYQALYHEHMIKIIEDRPYIWASYVWNMFDFASDARAEGGTRGRNNKGLVTFDRQVKKDAFYIYKAYLSDEPFVHICGRRYVERAEEITEVKIYSNQTFVTLYQNGRFLAEAEGDKIFRFQVELERDNVLEAVSGEVRDRIELRKEESPNQEYVLANNDGINDWFEVDYERKEGFFSVGDNLGEIAKAPEGKCIVDDVFFKYGVEMGDEVREMVLRRLSLKSLLEKLEVDRDIINELNQILNLIHKS